MRVALLLMCRVYLRGVTERVILVDEFTDVEALLKRVSRVVTSIACLSGAGSLPAEVVRIDANTSSVSTFATPSGTYTRWIELANWTLAPRARLCAFNVQGILARASNSLICCTS